MVRLRVKVGKKGQVLIPKVFREKYGMREGMEMEMEPVQEGILLKGRPNRDEALETLIKHAASLRSIGVKGSKLGDLKGIHLEREFDRP